MFLSSIRYNGAAMSNQTLRIKLTIAGCEVEAAVSVPTVPAPRQGLLPILRNLTDTIVTIAEQQAQADGRSVSCRKGCDACCRQMVPISPAEAHGLAEAVGGLSPELQSRILKRFERAEDQLARAGLLPRLETRHALSPAEQHQLDVDYFRAEIPCPFLEHRACTIHAVRPLACREYLVTSPAENCRNPTADQVRELALPAKVSTALASEDTAAWLPLTLARRFLAANPIAEAVDARATLNAILAAL
jgi:Fe-S-cluster containining protein